MEYAFNTREEASIAAADHISAALNRQLENQAESALVVSGGTSPIRCFAELASSDVAWQRVRLLLSDERWVAVDESDSNEKLIRDNLLQGRAAEARLQPMYDDSTSLEERCIALHESTKALPIPFACALIGMGEDGHFASLFPDAENLAEGLDVDGKTLCLPIRTSASPHARISLSLAALLLSDNIALLFFGEAKRAVYKRAKADSGAYPVSKLLIQKRAPVHVFWAP